MTDHSETGLVCAGSYTRPTRQRAGNKGRCSWCGEFVSLTGTATEPDVVDVHSGGSEADG